MNHGSPSIEWRKHGRRPMTPKHRPPLPKEFSHFPSLSYQLDLVVRSMLADGKKENLSKLALALNKMIDDMRPHDPRSRALTAWRSSDFVLKTRPMADIANVTCRKKCTFCCYRDAHLSEGEAIVLAEYVRQQPTVLNMELLQKQSLAQDIEDLSWAERACPFLDTDSKECRIYSHRPMACRAMLSQGNPLDCRNDDGVMKYYVHPDLEILKNAVWILEGTQRLSRILPKKIAEGEALQAEVNVTTGSVLSKCWKKLRSLWKA